MMMAPKDLTAIADCFPLMLMMITRAGGVSLAVAGCCLLDAMLCACCYGEVQKIEGGVSLPAG